MNSYRYLGIVFHATKGMKFGTVFLVAAARKALFGMRRQCLLPGVRDSARQCKLFGTLVLPILSYACEVWGVSPSVGAAANIAQRNAQSFVEGEDVLNARICRVWPFTIADSLLAADFAISPYNSSVK